MMKIDHPAFIQTAAAPESHAPSVKTAGQIFPAESIMGLAQAELGGIDAGALDETLEGMSLTMGSRLRDTRKGGDGKNNVSRAQAMLQQLVQQISAVAPEQLDTLLSRFTGLADAADPLETLRQGGLDAGQMALLLAALLADKGLAGSARKRLEDALAMAMEDEDWALMLFSHLESGAGTPAGLSQLKQLYRKAAARHMSLSQWFQQLRQMRGRQHKLKTLIRTLAFELSSGAGAVTDEHLVSVITDLKRILQFLGAEDHCHRAAAALEIPNLDGDRIMGELLETVDQSWVYAGWVEERACSVVPEESARYGYARRLSELIRLLPDDCFREDDQRDTIVQAFADYMETLADNE